MKRYLIVGGGQAGFSFAEQIRRKDTESNVLMLCAEPELPYQRPPLSKQYVKGEIPKSKLYFRDADWFERKDIRVKTSQTVLAIDTDQQHVTLADRTTEPYDKLMLSTGSTARELPASIGGDLDNVFTIRDINDADKFQSLLATGKRVLIVGGGYIGLEAAAVAAGFNCTVRVLEMSERILQRVACPDTSDFFRQLHKQHGVEISEQLALDRLDGVDGVVSKAFFKDGSSMDVDIVVVGIGIFPNTDLASAAGLSVDNGIVVNEFAQSSNPNIYAAGDCAGFEWRGNNIRLESVQNAVDQAKAAAKHACGEAEAYNPMPWFWSDQYDVTLQIAGLNTGYDVVIRRAGSREGGVSFWYFKGDSLLAIDAMNDPKTYVMGRKILELGKPISQQQAADSSVDLKAIAKGGI